MPKIHFVTGQADHEVAMGAELMQSLLAAGLPVASSCAGDGVCGKCRVQVVSGIENLSPAGDLEKGLAQKYQLGSDERIACQTRVNGDVTVTTTYW